MSNESMKPQTILLLTVGTGTAGRHSNVVEGLIAAVKKSMPDAFYLMPSASSTSVGAAEKVRKGCFRAGIRSFQPAGHGDPFFSFTDPDNFESCRREIADTLRTLRNRFPGSEVIINPTSGTKQMTAAAVVAALDVGLGTIQFIAGERVDGVVKTGTEKLAGFSTRSFLAERAVAEAMHLIRGGAYAHARRILAPFADLADPKALDRVAHLLGAWDRLRYPTAMTIALRGKSSTWQSCAGILRDLADRPVAGQEAHVADLLASAERRLKQGLAEEVYLRLYKAVEVFSKARLREKYQIPNPCPPDRLPGNIPEDLRRELLGLQRKDGIYLGLRQAVRILQNLEDSVGKTLACSTKTWNLIGWRNKIAHNTEVLAPTDLDADEMLKHVALFLSRHIPRLDYWRKRCTFPDPKVFLEEEHYG